MNSRKELMSNVLSLASSNRFAAIHVNSRKIGGTKIEWAMFAEEASDEQLENVFIKLESLSLRNWDRTRDAFSRELDKTPEPWKSALKHAGDTLHDVVVMLDARIGKGKWTAADAVEMTKLVMHQVSIGAEPAIS